MGSYDHMTWSSDLRSHFGSSPFVAPPQSPPTTHFKLGFGTCNVFGLVLARVLFFSCIGLPFDACGVWSLLIENQKLDPGSIQLPHPSLRIVLRNYIIDIFVNGRLERRGEAENKGCIRVAPRRCARSSIAKGREGIDAKAFLPSWIRVAPRRCARSPIAKGREGIDAKAFRPSGIRDAPVRAHAAL